MGVFFFPHLNFHGNFGIFSNFPWIFMAFQWNFGRFLHDFLPIFSWILIFFFPWFQGFFHYFLFLPFLNHFSPFFYHFCAVFSPFLCLFFPFSSIFYHFCWFFPPFPTEKSEQEPQIPKISDLTHQKKQNQGEFWGKIPKFWGFFAAQTLKIWFFFSQNWEFFGEKNGNFKPKSAQGKILGNLGRIWDLFTIFMAEKGPKKRQNCPKMAPKSGSSQGPSQGIWGNFWGIWGIFLGWNWVFWGGFRGFGVAWIVERIFGLNWADLGFLGSNLGFFRVRFADFGIKFGVFLSDLGFF